MISLLGLALLHVAGAGLRWLAGTRGAFVSPSSAWVAISVLYAASLGWFGLVLLAALVVAGVLLRGAETTARPGVALGVVAAVVLARPWVPTYWDEFVWLAKARLGFGGVEAALDPAQKVIPQGYPPLWPEAVSWVSLGQDSLHAHTLAASLLVLLALATALEVWAVKIQWWILAVPLVWVHLRATYLDLPVGLLGLALLGLLLQRPSVSAVAIAVVLVGIKDDGVAQVLAATGAALAFGASRSWRQAMPAGVALLAVGVWKWLTQQHGTAAVDHAFDGFAWPWISTLVKLFAVHATDVFSWGVFWAVALAALVLPDPRLRPLRAMLVLLVLLMAAALLIGPERVRVFAENGTLLNRLLLQLWPAAAAALLVRANRGDAARCQSPRV